LRSFLYWVEDEEIMPQGWKNPIRRVKAPKLPAYSGARWPVNPEQAVQ